MNLLSVSDIKYGDLYTPKVREMFPNVDFVIGCGDLNYYYLEYVADKLNAPLFFVRGNHDVLQEFYAGGVRTRPGGGVDLHRRHVNWNGVLMAGVEGCVRYNNRGQFQYTQSEMWGHVLSLIPGLLVNKLFRGRYLDIFITHAPPWEIHDQTDLTHQGIKAFRWLIKTFQPKYHFHGHIHVYEEDTQTETFLGKTQVLNTYGYRETKLTFHHKDTEITKVSVE